MYIIYIYKYCIKNIIVKHGGVRVCNKRNYFILFTNINMSTILYIVGGKNK